MLLENPRRLLFSIGLLLSISKSEEHNFDYWKLAIQWPGTMCNKQPCPYDWTIHGLWPQSTDGKHPSNCTKNEQYEFNLTYIKDIKGDMEKRWPSLIKKVTNEKFWEHEWIKHGTCSNFNQEDFFRKTLELATTYNIQRMLEDKNIRPSDSQVFDIVDIKKAIKDQTQYDPFISLNPWNRTCETMFILKEIFICFDKELKIEHCNQNQPAANVHYPPVKQGLQARLVQTAEDVCPLDKYDRNGYEQCSVSPLAFMMILAFNLHHLYMI